MHTAYEYIYTYITTYQPTMIVQQLVSFLQHICLLLLILLSLHYNDGAADAATHATQHAGESASAEASSASIASSSCHVTSHGCNLLLPKDIHYNTEIQSALSILRSDENDENVDDDEVNGGESDNPSITRTEQSGSATSLHAIKSLRDCTPIGSDGT